MNYWPIVVKMQQLKLVVDASAVLAVLKKEEGAIEASLKMRGGFISAVNYSEICYKAAAVDKSNIAEAIIHAADLTIEPFDRKQARIAAAIFESTKGRGVSFADRACLALSITEHVPVLTGDHSWAELGLPIEFAFFRPRNN